MQECCCDVIFSMCRETLVKLSVLLNIAGALMCCGTAWLVIVLVMDMIGICQVRAPFLSPFISPSPISLLHPHGLHTIAHCCRIHITSQRWSKHACSWLARQQPQPAAQQRLCKLSWWSTHLQAAAVLLPVLLPVLLVDSSDRGPSASLLHAHSLPGRLWDHWQQQRLRHRLHP
jgi:hypothetical protein